MWSDVWSELEHDLRVRCDRDRPGVARATTTVDERLDDLAGRRGEAGQACAGERGVPVQALLDQVATSASYLTAWSDGGYTTNLAVEDVADGKAWIAYEYDGGALESEHGGPARLLVPRCISGRARSGCADCG